MMKECCAIFCFKLKRILGYALIFALLVRSFPLWVKGVEQYNGALLISVVQSHDKYAGRTEIVLINENDAPFCGLLLSLESVKELRVISCQRGDAAGKATLSYDEGSSLLVMLDCFENISEKGVLARFWIDDPNGELALHKVLVSVICAYMIDGDSLMTIEVKLSYPQPDRRSNLSLCIEENSSDALLSFSGTVSSESFAACVDLWVLDVAAMKVERLCFSAVTDSLGRFDIGELHLNSGALYCIIVEFAEYSRLGTDFKEEMTFVLWGGDLY